MENKRIELLTEELRKEIKKEVMQELINKLTEELIYWENEEDIFMSKEYYTTLTIIKGIAKRKEL